MMRPTIADSSRRMSVEARRLSVDAAPANETEAERKLRLERELRQRTLQLKADVEDFGETVGEKPDKWLDNPCGWLLGPGEKRGVEVDTKNSSKGGLSKMVGNTNYKKRWFVLDSATRTLKYYENERARLEIGCIDMTTVIDIQGCTDLEAPSYSFDLVGRGGRCSLAGETYKDIIRWCYALDDVIKAIKPVGKSDLSNITSAEGVAARNSPRHNEDDKRWFRYSFVFQEAGPLMLNVVGLTDQDNQGNVQSHWLLVTSFARHQDGKPGLAERSNVIKVKDYIVGVNTTDLTTLAYHDAMAAIRNATFPKTVYFLRDLQTKQDTVFLENWVFANYAALNRRRKRYVELDSDNINFRKPTQGGSASVKRESYFSLDQISYLRPIRDLNFPEDSQNILRIVCSPGAQIHLVGNDDMSVGATPIEVLDLFFAEEKDMLEWSKYISRPALRPRKGGNTSVGSDLLVTPPETVPKTDYSESNYIDILGIRSYVSGTFAPREFSITDDGFLYWQRPPKTQGDQNVFRNERGRRFFLADERTCALRGIYACDDPNAEHDYKYQLMIQDINQIVCIGMPKEATLQKWIKLVKRVVEHSPESSRSHLTFPESILPLEVVMSAISEPSDETLEEESKEGVSAPRSSMFFSFMRSDSSKDVTNGGSRKSIFSFSHTRNTKVDLQGNTSPDSDTRGRSTSLFGGGRASMRMSMNFMSLNSAPIEEDGTPETVNGYRFYKHNSKVKKQFSRYWFSLKGYKLYYYKEKVRNTGNSPSSPSANKPLGFIDLLEVLEVRESIDLSSPENSLDLVMPSRVYQLSATDEDQCFKWLDALSETLEVRRVAVQEEESVKSQSNLSRAERINGMKKSVIFEGGLSLKKDSIMKAFVSWKQKYFVISKGAIFEFENQNEVFVTDNYKEIISIPAIRLIESSEDPNCNHGCAFDIHAYVTKGGNKDGMRVFTFEAQTVNLCKEWMTQICNATGSLVLKPKQGTDGFTSVVNDALKKKKDDILMNKGAKFVVIEKDRDVEYDEAGAFKKPVASRVAVNKEAAIEGRKHEFFKGPTAVSAARPGGGAGRGHALSAGRGGGPSVRSTPAIQTTVATPVGEGNDEEEEEEAAIPIVNEDFIPEPLPTKEFV